VDKNSGKCIIEKVNPINFYLFMSVPKWNQTSSKRDQRRANIFITPKNTNKCPKCGKPVLPHTACGYCGSYKGKEVIDVMAKLERKEKKNRGKEIKAKEVSEKASKPLSGSDLSK
jgi:large subunit ribosomal protein L32